MTPTQALDRMVYKATPVLPIEKSPTLKRFFYGAISSRLMGDWDVTNATGDKELRYTLDALRARSRDLARNDPYIRKFLRTLAINVVGPKGINLTAKCIDYNGKLDSFANKKIEASWYEWARKGNCTVDKKYSLTSLLETIIKTIARDGEILVRIIKGFPNKHRFALQLLEADYIVTTKNEILDNGNIVINGVELDRYGAHVAYYLYSEHPGSDPLTTFAENKILRVPAEDCRLLYMQERPSQNRGYPWSASTLENLKHLNGFVTAEVVAARTGACQGGVLTTPTGDDYIGDNDDTQIQLDMAPGLYQQLPAGWSLQQVTPNHPNIVFGDFVKNMLRGVSAGVGMNYNSLGCDGENINYSTMRQFALEDRDNYRTLQNFLIDNLLDVIYPKWLEIQLLNTQSPLSTFTGDVSKYLNVIFRARTWQWIDPLKDVNAQILALDNKLTSRTRIAEENGDDWIEIANEIAIEEKFLKENGLVSNDNIQSNK
jgi:lambda family phage portal protein